VRAAAVQLNSTADRAGNIERAERLTRAAAAGGAELVVLPEKFNLLGEGEVVAAGAEDLGGATAAWASGLAAELSIDLVAGSICERRPGARGANTALHFGPDGGVRAAYRKIHMFDVDVAGIRYRESETEEAGDEPALSRLADGAELGLAICYDLRFPELFRILALRGALVIALPSAFTKVTGAAHWEVLVRARAIENQVFVVAADQIGRHAEGKESFGSSMIVDPWGRVLARAPDEECFVAADLDFAEQARVRSDLPSLANRVESAYRWPAAAEGAGAAAADVAAAAEAAPPSPTGAAR
jgi:deaminated glutathione amidase